MFLLQQELFLAAGHINNNSSSYTLPDLASITRHSLVGDLGVDLLAGGLLKEAAGAVGDLLAGVLVDVVAGLLGAHVEGCFWSVC